MRADRKKRKPITDQRKLKPISLAGHLEDILQVGLARYNIQNARIEFGRYIHEKRLPSSALDHLEETCELLQMAEDAILEWYEDELMLLDDDDEEAE